MFQYFSNPAGLDIGSDAVRFLQIDRSFSIKELKEVVIPKQSVEPRSSQKLLAALVVLKKEMIQKNLAVVIGLSSQFITHQLIRLPKILSLAECSLEIENNLAEYWPDFSEKMVIDYFQQLNDKESEHLFAVIAAKEESVNVFYEMIHQAGFRLQAIDATVFALARCLYHLADHSSAILIDCREMFFNFIFITDQAQIFNETVTYLSDADLGKMIRKIITDCLTQHHLACRKIILSGLGSLSELKNFLQAELQMQVVIFSSFFPKNFPDDLINRSAIAFGLALWGRHDSH